MRTTLFLIAILALALFGCGEADNHDHAGDDHAHAEGTHTHADGTTHAEHAPDAEAHLPAVEVLETFDAGAYTYVRFEGTKGEEWAAAKQTTITVGERIVQPSGMVMKDFESPSTGQVFPEIYFVGGYTRVDEHDHPIDAAPAAMGGSAMGGATGMADAAQNAMSDAHGKVGDVVAEQISGIAKATGGYTVAELFAQKGELQGREVAVRGKVVKANLGIMGTNWYHIQDGSGAAGANDLTVTSDARAAVGDVVLIRGTAAENKDFGAGYKYELIVEKADLVVESL